MPPKAAKAKKAQGKAKAKKPAKVKAKGQGAKAAKAAKAKQNKVKSKPLPGKAFPLEKGPTPSKMEPNEITRLYKLPDGKLRTETDVIEANGYTLEEKLDAGGFGEIFFARLKSKNLRVACKLMDLGNDMNDSRIGDMKNELFIMEKVCHRYVVKLYKHFMVCSAENGKNRLYIFMQLADGGNLAKFLQKRQEEKGNNLTETEGKLYFAQIVCGINHMHSLGIAHRDIKLQNVLLLKDDKSISGDYTMLLADFGLSRILRHEKDGEIVANRTICGTPIFMAPELLLRKPYQAFAADCWALGITLWIMLTLELPFDFHDLKDAIQKMLDKKLDWPTAKMCQTPSEDLKSIVSSMLEPDATKRITLAGIMTHKWLAAEYKRAQALANKK